METEDDPQLRKLLQEWRVENAPGSLDARVLGPRRARWRLLLTTSIRVPIPAALSCAAVVIWMGVALAREHKSAALPAATQPGVSLVEYQPTEMHVRIVRSAR